MPKHPLSISLFTFYGVQYGSYRNPRKTHTGKTEKGNQCQYPYW